MNISDILSHMQDAWYMYLLGGIVVGVISWLHATYIKISQCFKLVDSLVKEFKPNSGSTIKDAMDRIESKINLMEFIKFAHLDLISTPVFLADDTGKYIWANKAYIKLTGLTTAELVGTGWESCIYEEDKNRVKKEWYAACLESRPFCTQFRMYVNPHNMFSSNNTLQVKCEAYGKHGVGYFGHIRDSKDK